MSLRFAELTTSDPLAQRLQAGNQGLQLTWLGQAGFALTTEHHCVLVDPYLSNSLAIKWAGTVYPHLRLQPIPVEPSELHHVGLVLASHRHTDHMDPATLRDLEDASDCLIGVPATWADRVVELAGIDPQRIVGLAEGEDRTLAGVRVHPVLAAHEEIERDSAGRSLHLGFVIELGGFRIYHSGDCIPYHGQVEALRALDVDVALLPVNGRDATRTARAVPGNFHPEEATALAEAIGAKAIVAHHFGLFDFNTVDQPRLDKARAELASSVTFLLPEIGSTYRVVADA